MSERDRIEIDFAKATRKAEEIEEYAGLLANLARSELEPALRMIAAGWGGDNADLFIGKAARAEPELLKVADELLKVARNIRVTSEVIYRAERAALRLL